MLYPSELRAPEGLLAAIARDENRPHNGGMIEAAEGAPRPTDAGALGGTHFRYYDFVMAAFVAILLLSNVIGAGKVAIVDLPVIGDWPFGAGILFFPVSYVIGDVLTEVYG